MRPTTESLETGGGRMVREPVRVLRALSLGLVLMAVSFQTVGGISQPVIPPQPDRVSLEVVQPRARVRFAALGTHRDRPTGDPETETHVTLGVGEGARRYLAVRGTDEADICNASVVSDPLSVRAVYLWQLDVQAVSVSPTQTTIELQWSRTRGSLGERQPEAGDTRTLTLGAGEYHVFDYVSAPPGVSSCANLFLRVLADPLPQPEPQPLVTVDLWLSQEGRTGRQWTHQRVAGRAGQPLPFQINPLQWSPSGAILRGPADRSAVGLDVAGTIEATVRSDRFVDVSVRVRRGLSWGRVWVEGDGQQEFRCAIDEAVALLMPQPKGQARIQTVAEVTPPFADGVFAQGDKTVVDFARFFAGSEAVLSIVVRRQP